MVWQWQRRLVFNIEETTNGLLVAPARPKAVLGVGAGVGRNGGPGYHPGNFLKILYAKPCILGGIFVR